MRWFFLVLTALALALIVGVLASASADDVYKPSNADEKVDLPVPKPTRPAGWEEEDTEEGEGDEEDDEDDGENPPIEFFDEEIDGDKVVYQLDYTGSMMGKVGHSIVDESGNTINNPTKMEHIKAEFAKSVLALSENVRFSVVMFATPAYQ